MKKSSSTNHSSIDRYNQMLITALGSALMDLLQATDTLELLCNPDGRIHVEQLQKGKYLTDIRLDANQVANIIKLVASYHDQVVDSHQPEVAVELPLLGARFQGWLPPVVSQACFAIRKRAERVITLDELCQQGVLTKEQQQTLQQAMHDHKNILIAGGTSSGKTTFTNALLHELVNSHERIIVLEDLPELQLTSEDVVIMRTTTEVNMRRLIKGVLRMRPDRIVIGEVRDGSALELLKAWNTGHPGGLCTIHANSAEDALLRLADLIREVIPVVPEHLINSAIDIVVFMRIVRGQRQVADLLVIE